MEKKQLSADISCKAQNTIYHEVDRIPGYKKSTATSIFICCPFHNEKQPSCGINTDIHHPRVPLGFFRCFGCGVKGNWNVLAEKLKLKTIKELDFKKDRVAVRDLNSMRTTLLGNETLTFKQLLDEFGVGLSTPYPSENGRWRTINPKLVNMTGAHLAYDRRSDDNVVIFPVEVEGDIVGGLKAITERDEDNKRQLAYVTSKGTWVKNKGLFPYDLVARMLRAKRIRSVALVEGSRDALRLIQYGIPAIAILGSQNFSKQKMNLILGLPIDHLIICMDGDLAGVKASNIIWGFAKAKIDTSVVKLRKVAKQLGKKKIDPGDAPVSVIRDIKKLLRKN